MLFIEVPISLDYSLFLPSDLSNSLESLYNEVMVRIYGKIFCPYIYQDIAQPQKIYQR